MSSKYADDVDALVSQYKREALQDENMMGETDPKAQFFVDTNWFNLLVAGVVAANAVTIGLETNGNRNEGSKGVWYVIEVVFALIFTAELGLRIWSKRYGFFTDPHTQAWNIFDLVLVVVAGIDTLFLTPILQIGGGLRFATFLRFLRLVRLVRLIRLFRIFRELWLVAQGLLAAMRPLLWITLMLFLLCYVCAMFTTLMVGRNNRDFDRYFKSSGGWDHERYFKNVWQSVLTLVQVVTLDDWSDSIARHVAQEQPYMYVFFIVFICFTSFGLLNIIVGVIVENTIRTANQDSKRLKKKRDRDRQMVFSQLREIFEAADVDGSGTLTIEEVEDAINQPEIYTKLRMIDFPVDNPKEVFVLLDYDNTGELTIEEFIKGCVRMKGPAMSKDLLVAQVAVDCMRRQYELFDRELAQFQDKLQRLDVTARAIVDSGEQVFLDNRQQRSRQPGDFGTMSVNSESSFLPPPPPLLPDLPNAKRDDQQLRHLARGESGATSQSYSMQGSLILDRPPPHFAGRAQHLRQVRDGGSSEVDHRELALPGEPVPFHPAR